MVAETTCPQAKRQAGCGTASKHGRNGGKIRRHANLLQESLGRLVRPRARQEMSARGALPKAHARGRGGGKASRARGSGSSDTGEAPTLTKATLNKFFGQSVDAASVADSLAGAPGSIVATTPRNSPAPSEDDEEILL